MKIYWAQYDKHFIYFSYEALWKEMIQTSKDIPKHLKSFKLAMDEGEYNLSMDILGVFSKTMEFHGLTYFLYGGTLLGSLRHHGPIPWDDDLDIAVKYEDREKIWTVFQKLHPEYVIHKPKRRKFWKLYSNHSVSTKKDYGWKWPFLDIWFMSDQGDYLEDWSCGSCKVKLPKDVIFPLTRRPFGDLNLYSPRKATDFVNLVYRWTRCESSPWSHRHEEPSKIRKKVVDCETLKKFYPFVEERVTHNTESWEYLKFRNKSISVKVIYE